MEVQQQQRQELIDDSTLKNGSRARFGNSKCSREECRFNLSTNCKTKPFTATKSKANKNNLRNTNNYKKRYPIVIFKWRPKMMATHLIYNLTILLVLLARIEVIRPIYCQQLYASQSSGGLFARNKPQSASDEIGNRQQQEQPQQRSRSGQQIGIPAANPNFEAAFQGECGKNNNSNPCEHICLDLHDGTYECSCFYGFTLAVDGYSCAPITVGQQQQSPRTVADANKADFNELATLSASATTGAVVGAPSAVNKAAAVARATANTTRPNPAADNSLLNGAKSSAVRPSESSSLQAEKSNSGNHFDANQQNSANVESADVVVGTSLESILSPLYQSQATGRSGNGKNRNETQQLAETLILNQANQHHHREYLPPKREGADDNLKFAADDDNEFARGVTAKLKPASKRNEIEGKPESARFSGGGKRQSHQEAGSNYEARQSVSEDDPTKPSRQRRLLEPAGRRETKAAASDSVVDGTSAAAFRSSQARWQTTTAASSIIGRDSLRLRTLGAGGQYDKLMHKHNHHHYHHQGERRNEIAASQPLRSPQTTTTNTNENSSSSNNYIDYKEEKFSPSGRSSKNKGPGGDKLVSYDVETIGAASSARLASPGRSVSSSNGEVPATSELIELNISYEDADPDIRSIMMSNDKLVSQLASLVAAEASAPLPQTNSNVGNERQQKNGKQQKDEMMTVADEDDLDRAQDYDQSSSSAEAAKTFGLLDTLVRRTIDEDYDAQGSSFWSRTLELSQQQAHSWPAVKAEMGMATTSGINEPFLAKPNRSSSDQDANSSGGGNRDADGGYILGVRNGSSRSRRSRINADQLQMQQQQQQQQQTTDSSGMVGSSSGSFDSMSMVRLPSNQIDVNNRLCSDTDKPLEVYRDCSELPECESGGQCIVESRWIPNKKSDLIQIEPRARCRCPIGRGGQLCQKPIQRTTPEFMGHSYLALPMITEPSLRSIRLVFRPNSELANNRESTLLVYSQKFILLLDDLNRVELRYLTTSTYNDGSEGDDDKQNNREYRKDFNEVIRVIGSRDAEFDKWNELIVTDASSSDSQANFVAGLNRIVLVTPDKIELKNSNPTIGIPQNISAEFFVAGLPDGLRNREDSGPQQSGRQSALGERSLGGFIGCISEFSLNQRVYNFKSDLNGDTLDGFDIGECCKPRESNQ